MSGVVVVIVGIADDRSASRIERNLKIVDEVAIRCSQRSPGGNVASVNEVIACCDLTKCRNFFVRVETLRVENVPVRVVVIDRI